MLWLRGLTPDEWNWVYLTFDFDFYWVAIQKEIPTFMCIKIKAARNWYFWKFLDSEDAKLFWYAEANFEYDILHILNIILNVLFFCLYLHSFRLEKIVKIIDSVFKEEINIHTAFKIWSYRARVYHSLISLSDLLKYHPSMNLK